MRDLYSTDRRFVWTLLTTGYLNSILTWLVRLRFSGRQINCEETISFSIKEKLLLKMKQLSSSANPSGLLISGKVWGLWPVFSSHLVSSQTKIHCCCLNLNGKRNALEKQWHEKCSWLMSVMRNGPEHAPQASRQLLWLYQVVIPQQGASKRQGVGHFVRTKQSFHTVKKTWLIQFKQLRQIFYPQMLSTLSHVWLHQIFISGYFWILCSCEFQFFHIFYN